MGPVRADEAGAVELEGAGQHVAAQGSAQLGCERGALTDRPQVDEQPRRVPVGEIDPLDLDHG